MQSSERRRLGPAEQWQRKSRVLDDRCRRVGRDPVSIERTVSIDNPDELAADDIHRDRGHIKSVVKAIDQNGTLVFADMVMLDSAVGRRTFAEELAERLNGAGPSADFIEQRLLVVFQKATESGESDEGPGLSMPQATALVRLAEDAELFHDQTGDAFATVHVGGHRETLAIRQRAFKDWLARRYYESRGTTPNSQALNDASGVLRGRALFDGAERRVYVRVAELGGGIYVDLADDAWRVVEITPGQWRVTADPPVKFRRTRGMLALPEPVRGGKLGKLHSFINVGNDEDWCLIVSWLVAALRPRGPYPILTFHGEQGSAKSSTERALRSLVDPNAAALRSRPRDERDLMIAASNSWIITLDNLSGLPDWLSDGLCRLATGGGFATRELYENDQEFLFDAQRPIILNGIDELAIRGDLQDRSIPINTPNIKRTDRKPEKTFWREFEEVRPVILGGLFDAVAAALKNEPEVKPTTLPRMADFAVWSIAAATELGWTGDDFLQAYRRSNGSSSDLPLQASPLTQPITALANLKGSWKGTVSELLAALNNGVEQETKRLKTWPKDAARLGNNLRRLAPSLRAIGINVEFPTSHKYGRQIKIESDMEAEPDPERPRNLLSPPSPEAESVRGDLAQGDSKAPQGDGNDGQIHEAEDGGDGGDSIFRSCSDGVLVTEPDEQADRCLKCGQPSPNGLTPCEACEAR